MSNGVVFVSVSGEREIFFALDELVRQSPLAMRRIVYGAAVELKRRVVENLSNKLLRRRSGNLAGGIAMALGLDRDDPSAVVAANAAYAAMQHYGGVQKPRNAKYLTIPFEGVVGHARDYPHSFLMKSRAGNLIIAQRGAYKGGVLTGGKIRPLFLLRKSVRIRPTYFMDRSFDEAVPKFNEIIAAETRRILS